jgi:hypothetical protein
MDPPKKHTSGSGVMACAKHKIELTVSAATVIGVSCLILAFLVISSPKDRMPRPEWVGWKQSAFGERIFYGRLGAGGEAQIHRALGVGPVLLIWPTPLQPSQVLQRMGASRGAGATNRAPAAAGPGR